MFFGVFNVKISVFFVIFTRFCNLSGGILRFVHLFGEVWQAIGLVFFMYDSTICCGLVFMGTQFMSRLCFIRKLGSF